MEGLFKNRAFFFDPFAVRAIDGKTHRLAYFPILAPAQLVTLSVQSYLLGKFLGGYIWSLHDSSLTRIKWIVFAYLPVSGISAAFFFATLLASAMFNGFIFAIFVNPFKKWILLPRQEHKVSKYCYESFFGLSVPGTLILLFSALCFLSLGYCNELLK